MESRSNRYPLAFGYALTFVGIVSARAWHNDLGSLGSKDPCLASLAKPPEAPIASSWYS